MTWYSPSFLLNYLKSDDKIKFLIRTADHRNECARQSVIQRSFKSFPSDNLSPFSCNHFARCFVKPESCLIKVAYVPLLRSFFSNAFLNVSRIFKMQHKILSGTIQKYCMPLIARKCYIRCYRLRSSFA